MDAKDETFLQIVRAQKAINKIPNKFLAFKCGVSQPLFSQYINGDVNMPENVKSRLIEELQLQEVIAELGLQANECFKEETTSETLVKRFIMTRCL